MSRLSGKIELRMKGFRGLTMLARIIPAGTVACVRQDGFGGSGHEPDVENQKVGAPDMVHSHCFGQYLSKEGTNEGLEKAI